MTDPIPGAGRESRTLTWVFLAVFVLASLILAAITASQGEQMHSPGEGVASAASELAAAPPSEATVGRILEGLDKAFNAGDLAAYMALFRPLHGEALKLLARRLRPLLSGEPPMSQSLTRRSKIVSFRQVGDRSIALVSSEIRSGSEEKINSREAAFLVCSRFGNASYALFQVEVDAKHLQSLLQQEEPGVFNCLACNYRIQARQDWLLVPHNNLRVGCLESISFYSLYYDLSIDLSVHVQENVNPAADTLTELSYGEVASEVSDWLPPAYGPGRMPAPVGLEGAQVDVQHADGRCSLLRLAVYGPIKYLMAVEGPAQTVQDRMPEIENVLSSFELIDPIFSPGYVPTGDRPSHLIGKLEGADFVDDLVQFSGPSGWKGSRSPDWHRFQITYHCPDSEAYMRYQGMQPPQGTEAWTQDAADMMLSSSLKSSGMRILADDGWQEGRELAMAGWPEVRRVEVAGEIAGKDARRSLRLALDAEILVLVEANDADRSASEVIEAALARLKLR